MWWRVKLTPIPQESHDPQDSWKLSAPSVQPKWVCARTSTALRASEKTFPKLRLHVWWQSLAALLGNTMTQPVKIDFACDRAVRETKWIVAFFPPLSSVAWKDSSQLTAQPWKVQICIEFARIHQISVWLWGGQITLSRAWLWRSSSKPCQGYKFGFRSLWCFSGVVCAHQSRKKICIKPV